MDRNTYNQLNRLQTISWPVRLMMKYGVKDQKLATKIVLGLSVVLLMVTFVLYGQIFSGPSTIELTPEEIAEMEAMNT